MKLKTTRITAILLALLCICGSLSLLSCGDETKEKETNPIVDETEPAETEAGEVNYLTALPDVVFDYEEVNIAVMSTREGYFTVDDPQTTIDRVTVQRNQSVEEKYNVLIEYDALESSQAKFSGVCSQMSMAGISDYDIFCPDYYYGLESSGAFVNLNDYTDVLDFSNPYWISGWNENVTINNKMFSAVGYYTRDIMAMVEVCFVNGFRAGQYTWEDGTSLNVAIYNLVESGDWTIDNMLKMAKMFTTHNESATYSFDDSYGLSYNIWSGRALLNAAGFKLSERDEDGNITFDCIDGETNYNAFLKLYNVLNDKENCYYGGGGGETDGEKGDIKLFTAGRSLFNFAELGRSASYATELDSVNVVPMPKYDSNQKSYVSSILGTCIFCIFKTAKNPTLSATILEAMNIYSYVDVRPVYYDLLKIHYQTDPLSSQAVEMVMSSINIDFLFCNAGSFVCTVDEKDYSVPDTAFDLIVNQHGDKFKSTMKQFSTQLVKKLKEYVKVYEDEK